MLFLLSSSSTLGTLYFPTLDTSISQSFPQSPRLGRILPSHAAAGKNPSQRTRDGGAAAHHGRRQRNAQRTAGSAPRQPSAAGERPILPEIVRGILPEIGAFSRGGDRRSPSRRTHHSPGDRDIRPAEPGGSRHHHSSHTAAHHCAVHVGQAGHVGHAAQSSGARSSEWAMSAWQS